MPYSAEVDVYALLWLTRECEARVARFLTSEGVRAPAVQRGMHLTVYHARRWLQGLEPGRRDVKNIAPSCETRFMVLAPGGENPRRDLEPKRRSVGVRLTRRNACIDEILQLRRACYKHETPEVVGRRDATTDWKNCFGARHYQPHVKLLNPGSEINRDLRPLGDAFRAAIKTLEFGAYEVKVASR